MRISLGRHSKIRRNMNGQEVGKSLAKREVYRNERRSLYVFEECRPTYLPEKNGRLLVCVQRSGLRGAGEGLHGLGWEVEQGQMGKAAEISGVPGSLIGSWHGPRYIVWSFSHCFPTSDVPILWSCWAKKYSFKIIRSSKVIDDKTHIHNNIGRTCLSVCSCSICSVCISGEEQDTEVHVPHVLANTSGACSPGNRDSDGRNRNLQF